MVLPDPDAAILDAHEKIEALEKRIDSLKEELESTDERLSSCWADDTTALNKRVEELEAGEILVQAALTKLRERIEKLETQATRFIGNDTENYERIEALEKSHVFHRDRLDERISRLDVIKLDSALKHIAERFEALEAKAQEVPTGEIEAFKRGRESLDAVTQKLVIAARAAYACHLRLPGDVVSALTSALKPFGVESAIGSLEMKRPVEGFESPDGRAYTVGDAIGLRREPEETDR